MSFSDLREFIDYLETIPGEVARVSEPLSPEGEIAAVMGFPVQGTPLVVVEQVRGYPHWQVVGNVLGTRRRVALALGVPEDVVEAEYMRRRTSGLAPVAAEEAPVKEVVVTREIDLKAILPVLTYHQGDAGPYITAGVCMAQDQVTRHYHLGIHRLQVKGPNRLGILLANPPLATYREEAEARGEALEIAIAVGVDPLLLLAAVSRVQRGADKLALAGALRGQPVPLAPAETLDLMVPAMAEIVIEGRVLPGVCEPEGPFGETSGYYFAFETQVLEVTAVTHRARPLYQAIVPASPEAESMLGFLAVAEMRQRLEELVEGFRGFVFVPGSGCFHGVLSLKKKSKTQARRAALLALNLDGRLKQITVVDEDVDISSPEDVIWAVATRCQPDTDIVVVPHLPGYIIDPSARDGVSAKVIIDATKPPGEEGRFTRTKPMADAWAIAARIWAGRR